MDELSTHLTRLRVYFENMADYLSEDTVNVPARMCKREYTGMRGQPKLEVSKRQIKFLRELHFRWVRIAELLGISTETQTRRRQEFQIDDDEEMNWSSVGNGELREIMHYIAWHHGKSKETPEFIFSWLSWLAVLLAGAYAPRRRRSRATWRP